MNTEFRSILEELKKPFPPDAHQERELKGGGRWFYLGWQTIRDRLSEVCPDWQIQYDEPKYLDKYCIVKGRLTICGVAREAWGNAEIELLSGSGKDMARGTPIERAIADCFKNCCEAFLLGAYLDEQTQDKREFTLRYLHGKGDGRAKKFATENGWIGTDQQIANGSTARTTPKPPPKPFGGTTNGNTPKIITAAQRTRFYTIAKNNGWTDGAAKKLLSEHNFTSSTEITIAKYDELCKLLQDKSKAALYNSQAAPIHSAPEQNEWS